jgi:TPR repeat protein
MYYQGLGKQQDYEKAVLWYEKAVKEEHPAAQYDLGICYYYGQGVAKNREKAIKLWKQSAEQEFEDAVEALKDLRK